MKEVKSWKGHDAVCSPARIRLRLYKDHSQSYIDAKVYVEDRVGLKKQKEKKI